MKVLAKKHLIIAAGCVLAMMCLAFYLATESEYVASCTFSCSRSGSPVTSETEKWRVEGYVKKFIESDSVRLLERDFLKTNNCNRLHVRRAFESCEIKVEKGSVHNVSIRVRARDRRLAKETVEFCVKGFADMVNERNQHVLEKHTARARVQIEKAKRRGEPELEDALREIEVVRASLKKENYRVFDVRDVKVRFHERRWRW